MVIGGHQRLRANDLREHPDETVPVVYLEGVSDAQAQALNIALNNQAAAGEFNIPKLADVLQAIDTGEFDVPVVTGFSEAELAGMVHGLDEHTRRPTDEDWALQFEASGDTAEVDGLKQVTFVLAAEDHDALMAHLKQYGAKKNVAIVQWLQASS